MSQALRGGGLQGISAFVVPTVTKEMRLESSSLKPNRKGGYHAGTLPEGEALHLLSRRGMVVSGGDSFFVVYCLLRA